jgi:hypothetical protein
MLREIKTLVSAIDFLLPNLTVKQALHLNL